MSRKGQKLSSNQNEKNIVEVYAKYLVGCDGAHSRVKKLLDIYLKGEFGKAILI